MSILTVGSIPDRGMRLNLPIVIVPLRHTDNGYWIFQPPTTYLGDEQMLRILVRGHSAPTVTEMIFVRAKRLNHFAIKAFYARGTKTGSVFVCLNIYNTILYTPRVLESQGIYEITSVHYPLSCLLLHPYYSTFRAP
jgi:hypothetical protein